MEFCLAVKTWDTACCDIGTFLTHTKGLVSLDSLAKTT